MALHFNTITDNYAFGRSVVWHPNITDQSRLSNDGNKLSCITLQGTAIQFQMDLENIGLVTKIYLTISGKYLIVL